MKPADTKLNDIPGSVDPKSVKDENAKVLAAAQRFIKKRPELIEKLKNV